MEITNAQYMKDYNTNTNVCIKCDIDGQHCSVPIDTANKTYVELKRQLDAGELTIADAEVGPTE
tara:strand:- start:52 stop:243 length:192 start_codon:yes stop_codon:yes gene_type:complete